MARVRRRRRSLPGNGPFRTTRRFGSDSSTGQLRRAPWHSLPPSPWMPTILWGLCFALAVAIYGIRAGAGKKSVTRLGWLHADRINEIDSRVEITAGVSTDRGLRNSDGNNSDGSYGLFRYNPAIPHFRRIGEHLLRRLLLCSFLFSDY